MQTGLTYHQTFCVFLTTTVPPHGVFLQLIAVLREVKYLGFQKQKDIPVGAEKLFAQKETLQKFVDNLDLMTGWYNKASGWGWCWSVPQVLPC